ncbi:hypothetical protein RYX36_009986 [Vicia faba]
MLCYKPIPLYLLLHIIRRSITVSPDPLEKAANKARGAIPLSIFGEEEDDEPVSDSSSNDFFSNGGGAVVKKGSDSNGSVGISDLISNLYHQQNGSALKSNVGSTSPKKSSVNDLNQDEDDDEDDGWEFKSAERETVNENFNVKVETPKHGNSAVGAGALLDSSDKVGERNLGFEFSPISASHSLQLSPKGESNENGVGFTMFNQTFGKLANAHSWPGSNQTLTDTKNISAVSIFFETMSYRLDESTGYIDYDQMEKSAGDIGLIIVGGRMEMQPHASENTGTVVCVGLPKKNPKVLKPAFTIPPKLLQSLVEDPKWDEKGSVTQNYNSFGVDAVTDLSNALEVSPDDDIIGELLRDTKEQLIKEGGHCAPGRLVIEEITEEVENVPSGNNRNSSTEQTIDQPKKSGDSSKSYNIANNGNLKSNSYSIDTLKKDPEAIRSFQNFISKADPATLASLNIGQSQDVSPDMIKASSDMIGKMSPEELQKMFDMASSFQGNNLFLRGGSSDSPFNSGSVPPNVTPDMLKTATDMISKMPPDDLKKMFEMASLMKGKESIPSAAAVDKKERNLSQSNFPSSSTTRAFRESSSSDNAFSNIINASEPNFPSSSTDLQEQMRNQMKDPAMRQVCS